MKTAFRVGAVGGLILLGLVLFEILHGGGAPLAWDLRIQERFLGWHSRILTDLAKTLHLAASTPATAVYAAFLVLAAWMGKWRKGAFAVAGVAGGIALLTEGLKVGAARPRPDAMGWLVHVSGGSLPSGHASGAMGVALLGILLARRLLRPGAYRKVAVTVLGLWPLAVGASRVYLGVHYASDVVVGCLLGVTWCSAWMLCFAP